MGNACTGYAESGVYCHVQSRWKRRLHGFSGESLVIHPNGDVLAKADDSEQLLTCEINLQEASQLRNKIPYLKTRRPECYLYGGTSS